MPPSDVLICDDNPTIRNLLADIVNRAGYAFDTVSDGNSAIEACTKYLYKLILLDVKMAGLDGLETARRIRALPSPHSDSVIVALTGYPGDISSIEFERAGIDLQLTKPESVQRITDVIIKAVSRYT